MNTRVGKTQVRADAAAADAACIAANVDIDSIHVGDGAAGSDAGRVDLRDGMRQFSCRPAANANADDTARRARLLSVETDGATAEPAVTMP